MNTLSEASAHPPASRQAILTRVTLGRERPGAQARLRWAEPPLCPGVGSLAWGRLEGHREHLAGTGEPPGPMLQAFIQ